MPVVQKIYLYLNSKETGPYSEDQVRVFVKTGAISSTQSAKHEGQLEWLPLNTIMSIDSDGSEGAPLPTKPAPPAKLLNILVVDDEKSTGKAVSYFLEQAGHKVKVVFDGAQAVQVIEKYPKVFHVIITDHMMSKMTGLELVEELQEMSFRGKIVVFTGNLTVDLESAYQLVGVKHFFKKPMDLKQLPELIAKLA